MFAGEMSRVVVQAVYFLLVARSLGSATYGGFASILALVAVLGPFSSWGWGTVMIKQTARQQSAFRGYLGQALAVTAVSGLLLSALAVASSWLIFRDRLPIAVPVSIALADLCFAKLSQLAAQAWQAHGRLGATASMHLLLSMTRLLGAAGMAIFIPQPSVSAWAAIYAGSTALAALMSLFAVFRWLGSPRWDRRIARDEMVEGFHYSVGLASYSIYNDIDKTILGHSANFAVNGIYTVGYRVIDMAFAPVRSLAFAAHARFFREGVGGIAATSVFANRLARAASVYGVALCICLVALAPVIPWVLGPSFAESADVVRFVAVIPLLRGVQYFYSEALTGAGYQHWRSYLQMLVAGVNVAANIILIPLYSWHGAAAVSIASDVILAMGMWFLVRRALLRERGTTPYQFLITP